MRPRKLSVLRINDLLRNIKPGKSVPRTDMPPKAIKVFTLDNFIGIYSWESALRFWSAYQNDPVPDLVVADVHFEYDHSSPIAQALPKLKNHLPTGLSHLKPFAALARANGRLIGVGIHTMEAGLWERLLHSDSSLYRCMSYLAAHEIGEVAAIMGEVNLVSQLGDMQSLEPLWRWLEKNAQASFNGALRVAVRNFRRQMQMLAVLSADRIPSIFIMPDDYVDVMKWCDRMRHTPQPLNEDNDCGLVLTYRDGRRDSIFLSSIFAEVEGITTRVLDAECFEPGIEDEPVSVDPVELDPLGNPRIGAFLARLGTLNVEYERALRALAIFPYLPGERSKISLRGALPTELFARGLVLLFQHLRIEKTTFERWHLRYSNYEWSPREGKFVGDLHKPQMSLKAALEKLLSLIRGVTRFHTDHTERESFSIHDVVEAIEEKQGITTSDAEGSWLSLVTKAMPPDAKNDWLRWHFDRLVDARILAHTTDSEYVLISQDRDVSMIPIPGIFPHDRTIEEILDLPTKKEWLKLSIGFEGNDNGIGQTFHDAFIQHDAKDANERAKSGRKFAEQYENGKGPSWLLRICENYAEIELRWYDRRFWPRWLHRDR